MNVRRIHAVDGRIKNDVDPQLRERLLGSLTRPLREGREEPRTRLDQSDVSMFGDRRELVSHLLLQLGNCPCNFNARRPSTDNHDLEVFLRLLSLLDALVGSQQAVLDRPSLTDVLHLQGVILNSRYAEGVSDTSCGQDEAIPGNLCTGVQPQRAILDIDLGDLTPHESDPGDCCSHRIRDVILR